jgi:hypothetical protein
MLSIDMDRDESGLIRKVCFKGRGAEIFSKIRPPSMPWDLFKVSQCLLPVSPNGTINFVIIKLLLLSQSAINFHAAKAVTFRIAYWWPRWRWAFKEL